MRARVGQHILSPHELLCMNGKDALSYIECQPGTQDTFLAEYNPWRLTVKSFDLDHTPKVSQSRPTLAPSHTTPSSLVFIYLPSTPFPLLCNPHSHFVNNKK